MRKRTLRQELASFRRFWNRNRHEHNYLRARRVFSCIFEYLQKRRSIPSAVQFEGLFRALRHEGKCGTDKKMAVFGRAFPSRVISKVRSAINHEKGCGVIGGGRGSIDTLLRSASSRGRFWKMLLAVRTARSAEEADGAVSDYAASPVRGMSSGIISPFLWALQHKWYPIVNEGSRDGLTAAIEGFDRSKDLITYVDKHVRRLRTIAREMAFKSFDEFDAFFVILSEEEVKIRGYRPPFVTDEEVLEDIGVEVERAIATARGSGFQINKHTRKAVEEHAMRKAKAYFRSCGYTKIEDVHKKASYDLICHKRNEVLLVEVKGTQGNGERVHLTHNEVRNAQTKYPRVALYVVRDIAVTGRGPKVKASGGRGICVQPWAVSEKALSPVSYMYRVDYSRAKKR